MSDPGLQVLEGIEVGLQIHPDRSLREDHGFAWWCGDFRQRIWAEPPIEEPAPGRFVAAMPYLRRIGIRSGWVAA